MLEICFFIVVGKLSCEIYLLGIGGKVDLVWLVFDIGVGVVLNVFVIDLGNCFCFLVNIVDVVVFK